ncbi:MAG: efflux RND transporter periplasmic adaptor subunit [Planctomycetia bacterium]|nr:efflux RND transporter periplasmic adaptor subunit [Planctomycetia bacterium]
MSAKCFTRGLLILVPMLIAACAAGVYFAPSLRTRFLAAVGAEAGYEKPVMKQPDEHAGHEHGSHDHAGHSEQNSIELSTQAQANIGLKLGKVELTTFNRTISVPGMLRERPGRSTVAITAPLTGIVTQIFPILGEAVQPGQKLFELRLTHEELVQAQGDFLRVAEELDVIEREIKRLEKIAVDGGIAGRQVLERQYEQQNKQAVLRAQHQALLLHGLSEEQVNGILTKRTLLRTLMVFVPEEQESAIKNESPIQVTYEIQELKIERGQSVTAGETMAVLTDHATLFIEGSAFDKDVLAVNRTIENGWLVDAAIETEDAPPQVISKLPILYVAGKVDPETRTFHFYVPLTNPLLRDVKSADGHRFLSWRYKPGQRVQVVVPVEKWKDRIVLPVGAVAQSGVETYVFSPNGDHFDRRAVHVEYRDRFSVVIANDGSLFPGDSVVLAGAQQMQLALKNKSGGAIDPHAGHNH